MRDIEEIKALVNPFAQDSSQGYSPKGQRVEEVRHEIDDDVERAFENYPHNRQILSREIRDLMPLRPSQIDTLLQLIKEHHPKKEVELMFTGKYLSRLICESYKQFNIKDFTLSTGDYRIQYFPHNRCSEISSGLIIRIVGNTGWGAGGELKDAEMIIEGCASNYTCCNCKESNITIRKDTGENCAKDSSNCRITIFGDAGEWLGHNADHCVVTVHGDIGGYVFNHGEANTFRTPNEATFKKAIESVRKDSYNIVQLIDSNGNILQEVKR